MSNCTELEELMIWQISGAGTLWSGFDSGGGCDWTSCATGESWTRLVQDFMVVINDNVSANRLGPGDDSWEIENCQVHPSSRFGSLLLETMAPSRLRGATINLWLLSDEFGVPVSNSPTPPQLGSKSICWEMESQSVQPPGPGANLGRIEISKDACVTLRLHSEVWTWRGQKLDTNVRRGKGSKSATGAGSKRTCCQHPRNGRREKFAGHPILG